MRLTDEDRSDLLDELLPTSSRVCVTSKDVLQWVRDERAARKSRERSLAIIATVLLVASAVFVLPPRVGPVSNNPVHRAGGDARLTSATARDVPRAYAPQKVDDDGLLGMLDDTPAALVQWPDGRRSLLVVVRSAAAE